MGMTVMVMDKEKIISLLKEMSDYFMECRTNASLGSKAENHFWELQIAAQDAATLLKEQEAVKVRYTAMGGLRYGACPKCDARVDNLVNPKACGFCGQELKWE